MMQLDRIIKLTLVFSLLVCFSSCYENETIVVEENEEANLRFDDDLTNLMKSVTSHDASYDDFIDDSHCFSINYPYKIQVGNEIRNIENEEDLEHLNNYDVEIEIIFPISISLINFEKHSISSEDELESVKQMCNDGMFYEEHINCADFIFPLTLAIYNTNSRRFNQVVLSSNKETFTFLDSLDQDSVFKVVYPANILMYEQEYFSIEDNFSLNTHFKIAHSTCANPE
ncbi:hypothetical protein GCM10010832_05520 [Psychroflexus planctonicus]|uniref:Lipoprotein n=2 Tax=Psychroflexus planctonicus TaxID=1526575 RepID=A0ABQ1SD03_9FLAO|nr:hypothetical protein GCM10010832_05520 [Psychroflexus planctonicus]